MPRYIVERDIPEPGSSEREDLRRAEAKSNSVLAAMQNEAKDIQWEHSYIAGNKTYVIYIADNETLIHEHELRSGYPAASISQVPRIVTQEQHENPGSIPNNLSFSIYFDLNEFSTEYIAEILAMLSELYESVGGDGLVIDDITLLNTSHILQVVE